jgi:hypothetical protein
MHSFVGHLCQFAHLRESFVCTYVCLYACMSVCIHDRLTRCYASAFITTLRATESGLRRLEIYSTAVLIVIEGCVLCVPDVSQERNEIEQNSTEEQRTLQTDIQNWTHCVPAIPTHA